MIVTVSQKLAILQQSRLFRAVPSVEREWLAPRCTIVRFSRGARIQRRGVPGQALYVVSQGRVKATLSSPVGDGEFFIGMNGVGDTFGECSVLECPDSIGNAVAMTDVQLLAVPRADVLALLERCPALRLRLLEAMADKLWSAVNLNVSLRSLDVPTRLYQRVLLLARSGFSQHDDGLHIQHGLSQQELADSIGVSREALNKVIAEWRRDGLVEWGRGFLLVRDLARLSARMPAGVRRDGIPTAVSAPAFLPTGTMSAPPLRAAHAM